MNRDEYDFLKLLSEVDERLVCEAGEMRKIHPNEKSSLSRELKAACAAFFILAGSMAVFHTEVEAAFQKMVTMISEMLGIEEDLSSFADVKGIPISQNGLTLTLEEVVLDKNQFFILLSQKFESDDAQVDTVLLQEVKINGVPLDTLNEYITDATLDEPIHNYLLSYYLDDSIVPEGNVEIDALFTLKNADNGSKIGKYHFAFHTTPEELEEKTVRIPMNQNIVITEDSELKLSEITFNCIESTIVGNCDKLPMGAEYYLKGQDDYGNEVTYRLLSYENPKVVFVKETDCHIAPDAEKLELQLYRHSWGEPDNASEEGDFIVGGSIDDDVSEMEPIEDSFIVNIRKNEAGKNNKTE